MNILIINASPRKEGNSWELTAAAAAGAERSGNPYETVYLNDLHLSVCRMCGDGWGLCRTKHRCVLGKDGLDALQDKMAAADAFVFVTPVYWGECSEAMKAFMDRIRRCEGSRRFTGNPQDFEAGLLFGKPCVMVACAGGSGNGTLSSLDQMNRFVSHCGGLFFDHIDVNRWSVSYKKQTVKEAVFTMATQGGGGRA